MRSSAFLGNVRSGYRRGFTLVEMMIALIITLMIVFAMVQAFSWVGETTTEGRASIEMLGQIRHARVRLDDDLSRCTVALDPWRTTAGQNVGYFELIEGVGSDTNPNRYFVRTAPAAVGPNTFNFADPNNTLSQQYQSLFGDADDVVALTARNDDLEYSGRYDGSTVRSPMAEILWWAELNDVDGDFAWTPGETIIVRRRVLLIRPDLNVNGFIVFAGNVQTDLDAFIRDNDISVRPVYDDAAGTFTGTPFQFRGIAANSLGDLTNRENRTAHQPGNYQTPRPSNGLAHDGSLWKFNVNRLPAFTAPDLIGEDVVLTNVLAFDFRVWDPHVAITNYASVAGEAASEGLVPGDPQYDNMVTNGPLPSALGGRVAGRGAFIDLGALRFNTVALNKAYMATNGVDDNGNMAIDSADAFESQNYPMFTDSMRLKSGLVTGGLPFDQNCVYDAWTMNYETDGFDQDAALTNYGIDQGTDGIDNDSSFGPDDLNERETSPPYPFPLTAIQVRIRMYEGDTRQVRQASHVVHFRTSE